ncbi:hypothetical protein ODS41_06950 [Pyrobaculum sp. 3827-6]|uniref:NifB/NifX family molybdenum-iron cluster-binding protein n=1 Tax=Pyrobaculum sp. 3827-6 TaxID=2983604 RepID=UPI0021D96C6D|nr:hypothetical protein [Pyrobaculum sp. 3827-6]MCU7787652.1 hypothetical protein [Pyrobaculum sp. 3827-6]
MKMAVACNQENVVFPGHFAHAPKFRIYKYDGGQLKLLEERTNPLGSVPDYDEHHHHEISVMNTDFQGEEAPPAHGPRGGASPGGSQAPSAASPPMGASPPSARSKGPSHAARRGAGGNYLSMCLETHPQIMNYGWRELSLA